MSAHALPSLALVLLGLGSDPDRGQDADALTTMARRIGAAVSEDPSALREHVDDTLFRALPWPQLRKIFVDFHKAHGAVVEVVEESRVSSGKGAFRRKEIYRDRRKETVLHLDPFEYDPLRETHAAGRKRLQKIVERIKAHMKRLDAEAEALGLEKTRGIVQEERFRSSHNRSSTRSASASPCRG